VRPTAFIAALLMTAATVVAQEGRFVDRMTLPDGRVVVVAEGDGEPRSIGSYSVHIYGAKNPQFPLDDFLCGVVRPRNGAVEKVLAADIDGDGSAEIVVRIRSAGTGGYLSADAFSSTGKEIILRASVANLPKDADVIAELRRSRAEKR
jgi:hypothetical protein